MATIAMPAIVAKGIDPLQETGNDRPDEREGNKPCRLPVHGNDPATCLSDMGALRYSREAFEEGGIRKRRGVFSA
jgi:hypothetical protein